jgi:hypothetical protein
LLGAAYDAVDWAAYAERFRGTPFYDVVRHPEGFLNLWGGGKSGGFRSFIADACDPHLDYLREHPEFNQVMHDAHLDAVREIKSNLLALAAARRH